MHSERNKNKTCILELEKVDIKKLILIGLIAQTGCVTEYLPELREREILITVEGIITDLPGTDTIRIYRSLPLWTKEPRQPIRHCDVWITDDTGNSDTLREVTIGTYVTDPSAFRGMPGRTYTLHFNTLESDGWHRYESIPMKMKPVPEIDSVYYEKEPGLISNVSVDGCRIYLDTHGQQDSCRYFRWEYVETWEFSLPFDVLNKTCWASASSERIMVENTSMLGKNSVSRFPLVKIDEPVEKLLRKYSILVKQYSLNEDEYRFWEKLQNSVSQVGGLYDIVPGTVTGNIYSLDNMYEKVAGYFSVSAVSMKRLFIKDNFQNHNQMYSNCVVDSAFYVFFPYPVDGYWWIRYDYTIPPPYIEYINQDQWGVTWWPIDEFPATTPPKRLITNKRWCADCTSKGSAIRPDFWDEDE